MSTMTLMSLLATTTVLLCVVIILQGIKTKPILPFKNLLRFYIVISAINTLPTLQSFFMIGTTKSIVTRTTDYVTTGIEMIAFGHIIYKILRSRVLKAITLSLCLLFSVVFTWLLVYDFSTAGIISKWSIQKLYTLENILLLFPCLFYFFELFRLDSDDQPKRIPHFWLITGLTFFVACTMPVSIYEHSLRQTNFLLWKQMYLLHYIFYLLFLSLIIKAYTVGRKSINTKH